MDEENEFRKIGSKLNEAINEFIHPMLDLNISILIQKELKRVIKTDISGKTIGIAGEQPFNYSDFVKLIMILGGEIHTWEIPWKEVDYLIIGKERFNVNYLEASIGMQNEILYMSQEVFLDLLLFGNEPCYYHGDVRIEEHPGLKFLSSIGFQWPSTYSTPGQNELEEVQWPNESELMKKCQYSVKKGISKRERRRRLRKGMKELELGYIVKHIANLVRIAKRRNDNIMKDAISRWEEDLNWIRKNYYEGTKHSFIWPDY